jgi:Cu-Zn family superoxide dismutase
VLGIFIATVLAAAAPAAASPAESAGAAISGPAGVSGTASLKEGPGGVLVDLTITGASPGWHGVHFHEKGACSDPKFQSAGGHINHAGAKRPHGLLNPQGPDFGDLPNLYVGADGTAHAQLYSPLVSLKGAGGRPALLDADGSAIVVHANADDQASQPIGGAGDRIACGAVTPVTR